MVNYQLSLDDLIGLNGYLLQAFSSASMRTGKRLAAAKGKMTNDK
jgi:hypothetical protein